MVSVARAPLDLVTHDAARPAFPAVYLEGHTVLSYGELAGLAGESDRVLSHDGKAIVPCGGDRDLPALLAYLAALQLGHAVAFLPASIDHELLEPADTGTGSWLQPRCTSCSADQR
jgi:hypothetical protein